MKPVLFVTNHAPDFRIGAFGALHEAEDVVFALIGGGVRHGGALAAADAALPFPVVRPPERGVARLAASGRFRAVVAGLSGRVALPAAYAGARAARVPFVLWATIWRHPRTVAHALSYVPLRHLYRHADAIATYGPHVSAYVRAKGARGAVVEAPQSVDDAFWTAPATPRRLAPFQALFAGRLEGEKGLPVLLDAWARAARAAARKRARPRGRRPAPGPCRRTGRARPGRLPAAEVRNFYAGSDVVVVPSVPTRDFLEPWGLVVNEAFDQGVPVIATTAVGATAGGLVEHERTGLVVPAGDAAALTAALDRLAADPELRARLGAAGRDGGRRGALPRRLGGRDAPRAGGRRCAKGLLAWLNRCACSGCWPRRWRCSSPLRRRTPPTGPRSSRTATPTATSTGTRRRRRSAMPATTSRRTSTSTRTAVTCSRARSAGARPAPSAAGAGAAARPAAGRRHGRRPAAHGRLARGAGGARVGRHGRGTRRCRSARSRSCPGRAASPPAPFATRCRPHSWPC